MKPKVTHRNHIVVNLIGDSGDGIQLIGVQLSNTAAAHNIDVNTLPTFPAEIRAPAGITAGISSFQLQLSGNKQLTAGNRAQILIAMNPAALKIGLKNVTHDALVIINSDSFNEKEWVKAGYSQNPLQDEALSDYSFLDIPITHLTKNALSEINIPFSQVSKCKNMFSLGLLCWMLSLKIDEIKTWLAIKFSNDIPLREANLQALITGFNFAETSELFYERYQIIPDVIYNKCLQKSCDGQITGNEALALGCLVAAIKSERPLLLAGYPITPASSLLQYVTKFQNDQIKVFQAEDEIAAACAAIGAAYGGSLGVTVTSGPGFDLKTEALGLAVITELPMVVIDVQRAGPSTGMPTKPEQSDLLASIYGRHGECPLPVISASTPGDCFNALLEAFRIAIKYMTPVILLSDAHLANASERWNLPQLDNIENLKPVFVDTSKDFMPYRRDQQTLARSWVVPGTKGKEHRIGGLEKEAITGNISYEPDNHQFMVKMRHEKINKIADELDLVITGKESGDILLISWGSTYGSVFSAVNLANEQNMSVSHIHLRYLNPLPNKLESILIKFKKIIVPELNMGQLSRVLREKYLIDVLSYNKVTGQQFSVNEIVDLIRSESHDKR